MPPSPKARRQSGSRAIGVSPITFPHKPSLHYTTAGQPRRGIYCFTCVLRLNGLLQLLQNRRIL
jgi:hypothetical protein